jgi:hypothetical protein
MLYQPIANFSEPPCVFEYDRDVKIAKSETETMRKKRKKVRKKRCDEGKNTAHLSVFTEPVTKSQNREKIRSLKQKIVGAEKRKSFFKFYY